MSVEADLAKARQKPIPEDKMRDLLTKARKKATGSFTLAKLVQMLDLLGWELEPVYGWVPHHYVSDGEDVLVQEHGNQNPTPADVAFMERKREEMLSVEHTELPEAGPETVGHDVVMEVGPMKKGYADLRLFYHKQWSGVEGIRFTSPRGDSVDVFPGRGDVVFKHIYVLTDVRNVADGGNIWRAILGADVEADIAAALGMEKHVPAAERTRENTGTCAHCWGNYKLDHGALVLHGYKRPRWGFTVGQCLGVGFAPLEKSVLGAEDSLGYLRNHLAGLERTLRDLESGDVDQIEWAKGKIAKRGDAHFERHLEDAVRRTKREISDVTSREIPLYEKVIEKWHERPMPKSGELQRGPGFFTK